MRISLITVKLLPAVTLTLLNSSLHELLYISQENIFTFYPTFIFQLWSFQIKILQRSFTKSL